MPVEVIKALGVMIREPALSVAIVGVALRAER